MPVFGSLHELSSKRIAFDIAADCIKMLVTFHGKGLEATLVDRTRTRGRVVRMPAHALRVRQPAAEVSQAAVVLWPKHKMKD